MIMARTTLPFAIVVQRRAGKWAEEDVLDY
jgi:hypothetical protein